MLVFPEGKGSALEGMGSEVLAVCLFSKGLKTILHVIFDFRLSYVSQVGCKNGQTNKEDK